jgi:hypothetical protein
MVLGRPVGVGDDDLALRLGPGDELHDGQHRSDPGPRALASRSGASVDTTTKSRVNPDYALPRPCNGVPNGCGSWDYRDTWGTGGDLVEYQRNPRYLKLKGQVADAILARAADDVPGLAGLGRLSHQTPIVNLFLAGAWTNSGSMIPAMSSGLSAARRALTKTQTRTVTA